MIKAENICKQFTRNIESENKSLFKGKTKEEFFAVSDISFTANKGEILGILGPNGAGKTTLLRILGGLLTPTSGKVTVCDMDGNEVTSDIERKYKIGYLSGNTKLYNRFSIVEMLSTFADVYGISKEEKTRRIDEICDVLNLNDFKNNRIEKLSTGQTQRANIARCLIHNPDIYIFDEPTLGLDIISSESIINFMKSERDKGKTVLYSTHYMEEAQYLCDKIFMMHESKMIAFDSSAGLMSETGTDNLRDTFKVLIEAPGEVRE